MKKMIPYILLFCVCVMGMTGINFQQTMGKRIITPITFGITDTAAQSETIDFRGMCEQIEFDCAENTDNNITFTLTVATADGGTLCTKSGIADNGSTILKATSDATDFDAFLAGDDVVVTVTPSGAPGTSTATVNVGFYLR